MPVVCLHPGCGSFPAQPDEVDAQTAATALLVHTLTAHGGLGGPPQGARGSGVRAPAITRPSIDIGCSPAQWAEFLGQWSGFLDACDITEAQEAAQCMACFSSELVNTADKQIANLRTLSVTQLLVRVKAVAVKRVSVGVRRSNAYSVKQAAG